MLVDIFPSCNKFVHAQSMGLHHFLKSAHLAQCTPPTSPVHKVLASLSAC